MTNFIKLALFFVLIVIISNFVPHNSLKDFTEMMKAYEKSAESNTVAPPSNANTPELPAGVNENPNK